MAQILTSLHMLTGGCKACSNKSSQIQDVARQLARLGVQTLPVELPIHYRGRDHFEEYRDDNPAIISLKQMFQIHNWTYPFRAVDTNISKETHCFSFNTDAYLARTFVWKRDAGDIVVMDRRCLGNPMSGGHYLNFANMDVVDFTKEAPSDYFSKIYCSRQALCRWKSQQKVSSYKWRFFFLTVKDMSFYIICPLIKVEFFKGYQADQH